MGGAVDETVAMVTRDGKHLLGYSASNNRHEAQVGPGAAGRGIGHVVPVLVPLVLTMLLGLPAVYFGGGVRRRQTGQLAVSLERRETRTSEGPP